VSREADDGFLSRWSRLKRAQAEAAPRPAPVEEPSPEDAAPETPAPEQGPATLSEEELAALPRIEDLTEGSDIRPFLRAGVPGDLRNSALRRIWMLTPGIRDYNDPAVDYAWDWNTPGGVPGDGVAPSAERAAEMLRDLFAPKTRPKPPVAEEEDSPEAKEREPAPDSPAEQEAPSVTDETEKAPNLARETAENREASADSGEALPRRRHGSALPS